MGDQNHNLHLFEEFLVLRGAVEQVFRMSVAGERGQDVAVVWRQKRTVEIHWRLLNLLSGDSLLNKNFLILDRLLL